MKAQFEKKLIEQGFSFKCHTDDYYILSHKNDDMGNVTVQFIYSELPDEVIQISNNGNEIEAIGHFNLKLLNQIEDSDFLILAFQNTNNQSVNFIIIPRFELIKRLYKDNRISNVTQIIETVFWLLPDHCLYDCTDLGTEGEWFYMSKGTNGRMADNTEMNYTEFLNNWNVLIAL